MRVFYDDIDTTELNKQVRRWLFEEENDDSWVTEEDIPDSKVYDWATGWLQCDREDVQAILEDVLSTGKYLITGVCGRWNGRFRGGKYIKSFRELQRIIGHLAYIKVYEDDNGDLRIEGDHHDGSDEYLIRKITEVGEDTIARWECDELQITEEQLHGMLVESYSEPVWLSNRW